jgi:hypothetical protein
MTTFCLKIIITFHANYFYKKLYVMISKSYRKTIEYVTTEDLLFIVVLSKIASKTMRTSTSFQ